MSTNGRSTETNAGADRSTDPPRPPEGYDDPHRFEYPKAVLLLGSGLLGIVASIAFGALLLAIRGPDVFADLYEVTAEGDTTTFAMDLTVVAIPFVVALLVTAVVHELIHGAVFRFYGYDVSYGFVPTMGAFFAATFDQFQTREELLRIGAAPLLVITVVCAPLLVVSHSIVVLTALFVLVLNTAGAIGDLYLLWRLRRLPPGTLLYDRDIQHSYIYEPLEQ